MKPGIVKKRDQIIQRLWDAQDNATESHAPEVVSAAQTAIDQLETILKGADEAADPLQIGKTYKFLGDAYYTLSAGQDQELITKTCETYIHGERLLEATDDQLTLAKLNFNLGNAYRKLGGGYNRANMEEARRRYHSALKLFNSVQPESAATVLDSIQDLEIAIRALGMFETSTAEKERSERLMRRLELAGADPDPEVLKSIQAEVDEMGAAANKDALKMIEFMQKTQGLNNSSGDGAAEQLQKLKGFVSESATEHEAASRQADDELFGQAFAMLKNSVATGETTKDKAEDLESLLKQFQGMVTRPEQTPAEMLAHSQEEREFIDRFKKAYRPDAGDEEG
ncbi:MAG: hypothetical protein ACRD9S_23990 [Pyrinomonadaceae bacterium]